MTQSHLRPIDPESLPEYPISSECRLDSHYFMQFNLDRFERSNFRKKSYRDPEVGFFGLELFFKSHGETPLGTLPADDDSLAFLLGLPLEKWMALKGRDFNPLYNWSPVLCDNGEIRLGHKVVREVMEAALRGHQEYKASNEVKAVYARRKRLVESLRESGCGDDLCTDEFAVGWLDDWLTENHVGQRRMPQLRHSIGRALSAAAKAGVLGKRRTGV